MPNSFKAFYANCRAGANFIKFRPFGVFASSHVRSGPAKSVKWRALLFLNDQSDTNFSVDSLNSEACSTTHNVPSRRQIAILSTAMRLYDWNQFYVYLDTGPSGKFQGCLRHQLSLRAVCHSLKSFKLHSRRNRTFLGTLIRWMMSCGEQR